MCKRPWSAALLFAAALTVSAPWAQPQEAAQNDIPAYHPAPPQRGEKLPPLLPAEQLLGPEYQYAFQSHAYELAPKISSILYQEPCYCRCDRNEGHTSLRSCYEGTHAANCGACLKELYYTYDAHKKGKSVREIRKGISAGDWKKIDLQAAASDN